MMHLILFPLMQFYWATECAISQKCVKRSFGWRIPAIFWYSYGSFAFKVMENGRNQSSLFNSWLTLDSNYALEVERHNQRQY